VLNVGTGKGTSVLEIVQAFERVTNVSLRYAIGGRREGDVVETYADTTKINRTLDWQAAKTLDDALRSAWNWEKKLRGIS
jgi:UDP-glucose 4-epimerase